MKTMDAEMDSNPDNPWDDGEDLGEDAELVAMFLAGPKAIAADQQRHVRRDTMMVIPVIAPGSRIDEAHETKFMHWHSRSEREALEASGWTVLR